MNTEKRLIEEIEKWTAKLKREFSKAEALDKKGESFLKNIRAYFQDSAHFYAQRDYVRSFEALVWAWSWLEIGRELRHIT